MTHASLCTGIGAFDLAAHWLSVPTVWTCEIEPYARRVLQERFPHAPCYDNLLTLDPYALEKPTILTAGIPCQPFSSANNARKGTDDDRFIWPGVLSIIDATRPAWVCIENVSGFVQLGGYDHVAADLEATGYAVGACIIPACASGAWHRRDRVWLIAEYADGQRSPGELRGGIQPAGALHVGTAGEGAAEHTSGVRPQEHLCPAVAGQPNAGTGLQSATGRDATHAKGDGRTEAAPECGPVPPGQGYDERPHGAGAIPPFGTAPARRQSEHPIAYARRLLAACGFNPVEHDRPRLPYHVVADTYEQMMGFPDGWTRLSDYDPEHKPTQRARVKACGNSMYVPVCYQILKAILNA